MAAEEEKSGEHSQGINVADVVRMMVLGWSATLLTVSYLNIIPGMKMDSTFVASLLTGAMAGFGIERKAPGQKKKDAPTVDPEKAKPTA